MRSFPLFFALFFALQSCSQGSSREMNPSKWSSDLDYLEETILKKFALFTDASRKQFTDAVQALRENLPSFSNDETIVGFNKMVARLNDGHTELNLLQSAIGYDRLPIVAWYFGDDLVITHTDESHISLLGARIRKIGVMDMREVRKKIIPLLAHDNEIEYLLEVPNYMLAPAILKVLGIVEDPKEVVLTIETANGETRKENLHPVIYADYLKLNFKRLRPVEKFPFYLQNLDKNYWFKYLEETGILYFKINKSDNQKQEKNLSAFINDFMDEYETKHPGKVVIDIRLNRGGNYDKTTKLADVLKEHKELHEKGKLWVITDRYTFSAAVVLAAQLKLSANAQIIGEEARGNPNGSDNYEEYTLPRSGIKFGVTNRIKNHYPPGISSPYLPLDIPVSTGLAEYVKGFDPVMEYIKNYKF